MLYIYVLDVSKPLPLIQCTLKVTRILVLVCQCSWPPVLCSFPAQPLVKQDSLDTYNERDPFKNDDTRDEEEDPEDTDSGIEGEVDPLDRDVIIQPPPPPPPLRPPAERVNFPKGLPWAPKVR